MIWKRFFYCLNEWLSLKQTNLIYNFYIDVSSFFFLMMKIVLLLVTLALAFSSEATSQETSEDLPGGFFDLEDKYLTLPLENTKDHPLADL